MLYFQSSYSGNISNFSEEYQLLNESASSSSVGSSSVSAADRVEEMADLVYFRIALTVMVLCFAPELA